MKFILAASGLLLLAGAAFAQGDRGTITGTVSDPAGAVVASAVIEAKHVETGAIYTTQSTTTGNYTLSQLPFGSYEISAAVPGFKKYVRQGLDVGVAQTLRIDIILEVGNASESVTVTEAAPLLKTESGELSHNVTSDRLDSLPVLGIGAAASSAGIRNPLAVVQILPGTYSVLNSIVKINGAPSNTMSIRIEGQDATNGYVPATPAQNQPSVDAIQEYAIQTSNFAAEYGQVGGGFFNLTMKSGTNQYHGTAYDYFVNEALNSGQPYTSDGHGNLLRPVARRNDYGFTVGGPVSIPRLYNGRDKTFFFFNWEQYRETQNINTQSITVPIQAYRDGNFTQALTGKRLNTDPLGRPILENTIYDPNTQRLAQNGQIVRDPFPNNAILATSFDPVAAKVQALIPAPTKPNALVNNAIYPYLSQRLTEIPAIKIDQLIGTKDKVSFYWSETKTANAYNPTLGGSDGLPEPITAAIGTYDHTHTFRVNYDRPLTPTLLLHFGVGYMWKFFNDDSVTQNYNAEAALGLKGATVNRTFPGFGGLSVAQGGVKNLGNSSGRNVWYQKPTANASLTWVKNNHTIKAGGEMRLDGLPNRLYGGTAGSYNFSAAETGLPSTQGQSLAGGSVGFPYASFLLGLVDSGSISNPVSLRLGKKQLGFFVQDTWKVNRKFTLDYGLRYDYSTYLKETYGRLPDFSPTLPNPGAGGQPGAVIFEGDGPGRCNCELAHNYPWAFGPRLGAAYQINAKTVFRAGWGIVSSGTADNYSLSSSVANPSPFASSSFGQPIMTLQNGIPAALAPTPWPDFNSGQYPLAGQIQAPKVAIDPNGGRPARQMQWSVGLQREILKNLAIEAAYVGNRGVWWTAPILIDVNANTPQALLARGLDINSATDRGVLAAPVNSAMAAARGFGQGPYTGFPVTATVAQALRPFPQFGSIIYLWSPLGKNWYDSLQVKATKRFSRGLSFTSVFSWQKTLDLAAESAVGPGVSKGTAAVNDVFNRGQNKYISQYDQPLVWNNSVNYTVQAFKFGNGMAAKAASWAARDWSVGAVFTYASGLPIQAPAAQNSLSTILFRGTFANRVAGQPLFTQDINCHCYDPNKTFILNPKAWSDPLPGQFGTAAAYYSDYRFQRRPVESLSVGRIFRIRESMSLNIRAEFTNVFNRAEPSNPVSTNALATQTKNLAGQTTAGFGYINTTAVVVQPRQGTLVARFQF